VTVVEPVLDHAAAERARLVNKNRAELLRSGKAVDLELLARSREKSLDAVRQWVRRHRRTDELVYVLHNGATYVPTFQLDEAFDLDHTVTPFVSALLSRGFTDWAVWTWFESTSSWLDGRTPASALRAGDTHRVERALAGLLQE